MTKRQPETSPNPKLESRQNAPSVNAIGRLDVSLLCEIASHLDSTDFRNFISTCRLLSVCRGDVRTVGQVLVNTHGIEAGKYAIANNLGNRVVRFIATNVNQDGFDAIWDFVLESNDDDASILLADIAGKKRVWAKLKGEVQAVNEQRFLALVFAANLDDTAKYELLKYINERHGAPQVDIISPSGSFLDAARFVLSTQNPFGNMIPGMPNTNTILLIIVLIKNTGKLFERRFLPLLQSNSYAQEWTLNALTFIRLSPNPDVAIRVRQILHHLPEVKPENHGMLLCSIARLGDIETIDMVIAKSSPNIHKVLEGCAAYLPENIDTFLHYIDQLPSGKSLDTETLELIINGFSKPALFAFSLYKFFWSRPLTACELQGVWNDYVTEARSEDTAAGFDYAADLKVYQFLTRLVNDGLIGVRNLEFAMQIIINDELEAVEDSDTD
jgi:hypothetical protein